MKKYDLDKPALLHSISTQQMQVDDWMLECFGEEISSNKQERNFRFLEEALELVQSCGATKEEAMKLVDYVFDRPVGVLIQEVGGVMVTLYALCNTNNVDVMDAAQIEINRITQPEIMEKIRAKQAAKLIKAGPLP